MTIKIVGAGYGRTGTLSTRQALNTLGFPCYHMHDVIGQEMKPGHLEFWLKVARSPAMSQHDWGRVFSDFSATIDNPASCVWQELMQAYPDAKVLLTLHPKGAQAWYESTINTIYFTRTSWQFKVVEFFTPFGRKIGEMTHKLIWQRNHKASMEDRDAAIAEYYKHIELVKASVPADKLLVFSADQGWNPLCEFLGVEAPDEDFPNVNDRAQIKETIAGITSGAYVILAGIGAVGAALIYAVGNWF